MANRFDPLVKSWPQSQWSRHRPLLAGGGTEFELKTGQIRHAADPAPCIDDNNVATRSMAQELRLEQSSSIRRRSPSRRDAAASESRGAYGDDCSAKPKPLEVAGIRFKGIRNPRVVEFVRG